MLSPAATRTGKKSAIRARRREVIDVRGPDDGLLFGDRREYTWFIRDGFFVRSPVRANGVTIADGDRRTYERQWLERERRREQAAAARRGQAPDTAAGNLDIAQDVSGLLRQSREPRFISAGYFLEFTFEPGNYYVAGREALNGRDVLRVEYFPAKLFGNDERRKRRGKEPPSRRDREVNEKMNRTAVVTLWVEPDTAEIRRYTFENLGLDFLPAAWLVRVTEGACRREHDRAVRRRPAARDDSDPGGAPVCERDLPRSVRPRIPRLQAGAGTIDDHPPALTAA